MDERRDKWHYHWFAGMNHWVVTDWRAISAGCPIYLPACASTTRRRRPESGTTARSSEPGSPRR